MFQVELNVTYRCFSPYQQADNLLQQFGTSNLLLNALTSTKTVGENPCTSMSHLSWFLMTPNSTADQTSQFGGTRYFFSSSNLRAEGITVSAGQGKVSKPWTQVHHHNMSKNFTLHFYLCIILPSNIIISHSCVISIRNQNDIRISCRVLPLSARMEAPYKAMCSTRKPFRTPLKLAETRKPLHQDFYFSLSVKMPSDGVCS